MAKGNALPIILLGGGALLLLTMGSKKKSSSSAGSGGSQGYKTPSGKDGNVKDVPVYIGTTQADLDYFKDLIQKNYDRAIVLIYDPAKNAIGNINSIASQFATQNRDVAFLIGPCTYPDDISCDMTIFVAVGGRLSNGDFSVEDFESNVTPEQLPGVIESVYEAFNNQGVFANVVTARPTPADSQQASQAIRVKMNQYPGSLSVFTDDAGYQGALDVVEQLASEYPQLGFSVVNTQEIQTPTAPITVTGSNRSSDIAQLLGERLTAGELRNNAGAFMNYVESWAANPSQEPPVFVTIQGSRF